MNPTVYGNNLTRLGPFLTVTLIIIDSLNHINCQCFCLTCMLIFFIVCQIQKDNFSKTGCHDLKCFGFVQVSSTQYLGCVLEPVSEDGDYNHQYEVCIAIYKVIYSCFTPFNCMLKKISKCFTI